MKNKQSALNPTKIILIAVIACGIYFFANAKADQEKLQLANPLIAQEACIPSAESNPDALPVGGAECNPGLFNECRKFGMNYAVVGNVDDGFKDRAAVLNMGYALLLATDTSQATAIGDQFSTLLDRNITPVLRICVGGQECPFADVSAYIQFLNDVSTRTGDREFYAIAGPNEPITEVWLGGQEGSPESYAGPVATYMNNVIEGVANKPNIKLLSPAFNLTHPSLEREIAALEGAGAQFDRLAGIAGNTYNILPGEGQTDDTTSVRHYLNRLQGTGLYRDLFITETGMFDNNRNPRNPNGYDLDRSIARFKVEWDALKVDPAVKAVMIFNGFGTNTDSTFQYNVLDDNQYTNILTIQCLQQVNAC